MLVLMVKDGVTLANSALDTDTDTETGTGTETGGDDDDDKTDDDDAAAASAAFCSAANFAAFAANATGPGGRPRTPFLGCRIPPVNAEGGCGGGAIRGNTKGFLGGAKLGPAEDIKLLPPGKDPNKPVLDNMGGLVAANGLVAVVPTLSNRAGALATLAPPADRPAVLTLAFEHTSLPVVDDAYEAEDAVGENGGLMLPLTLLLLLLLW
jgi:hypothetical protein